MQKQRLFHRIQKQKEWDTTYMMMALMTEGHSKDPKHKVAAIIVSNHDGSIIGFGYNGRAAGSENDRLSMEHGKSGFIHAEMNAMMKAPWNHAITYTIYCTVAPCIVCAGLILNSPITRVVYMRKYNDDIDGLAELIKSKRIDVSQFIPDTSRGMLSRLATATMAEYISVKEECGMPSADILGNEIKRDEYGHLLFIKENATVDSEDINCDDRR